MLGTFKHLAQRYPKGVLAAKTALAVPAVIGNGDFRTIVLGSLWRRADGGATMGDAHGLSPDATLDHVRLATEWILHCQRIQPDGGVTAWIWLFPKYRAATSYPEVTGYIIPTMFDCAGILQRDECRESAVRMADFECAIQWEDGAWQGDAIGRSDKPSVFNSAMIIHGLVRAYRETGEAKYLDSAVRGGRWICSSQDPDGSWWKLNYDGMKRVYDSKVAESLCELALASGEESFARAATKNLDFVLANQRANAWFEHCDNSPHRNHEPLTHTIGYTVQGLIESGLMLDRQDYVDAARRTLDVLLRKFELTRDLLPGRFDRNWAPTVRSACVTGCAQISICWMRLFELTGDMGYLNAALKMNDHLKTIQYRDGDPRIKGALPSCYPVWGDYGTWTINSWSVKYYLDALMAEHHHKNTLTGDEA